jgi:hypothetical protein
MEAGFNARRIGIRCMGETSQERMKMLTSEEDMRVDIPGIIVSYSFPQILYTHNPDSQFSPRSCIFVLSQTADHLESIPIFKECLETGVVLRAEPFSLAF